MRMKRVGYAGALVVAGALMAPPAQAGNWVLHHYDCNGHNSITPAGTAPNPQVWPSPVFAADAPGGITQGIDIAKQASGSAASFSISASSSGSIVPVFEVDSRCR